MTRKSGQRRANWKDGRVTVDKMQEVLKEACPHMFMMTNQQWIAAEKDFLGLYSSQEMHKGFNSKLLIGWAPTIIKPLMTNDPRGAKDRHCSWRGRGKQGPRGADGVGDGLGQSSVAHFHRSWKIELVARPVPLLMLPYPF